MVNQDRFSGEFTEPPMWGHCEYCGSAIHLGGDYWVHDGLCICDDCAKRYAWTVFTIQAHRQTAIKDSVL